MVRPVGSDREVPFEARIVAATHRDLEAAVAQGSFRQDLFYRVNVIEVALPPLRARAVTCCSGATFLVALRGAACSR